MMETTTIKRALLLQPLTRHYFRDVRPADLLPPKKYQEGIYVVNTHPNRLQGEHWVTVEYTDTHVIYFDPLGLPPHPTILSNLRKSKALQKKTLIHHTTRRQGERHTCGLYCIYHILTRTTTQHTMDVFNTDLDFNDRLVYRLVHTYFKLT